jgi:integral membrane protein
VWKNPLRTFTLVGYCEGISFLVLLGIATPLKRLAGIPEPVFVIGWIHGILWIVYMLTASRCRSVYKWRFRTFLGAALASVLPFGPFVFDRWLRNTASRPAEAASGAASAAR